jgi:pimeloyl-ACP methyl ester carboxylesterase
MRTASGLTYEVMHGRGPAIVACTCWTEATPVIATLDTHWLRRLAQEYTLVLTNHRGLAGSAGRADLASEIFGLREVVDAVGAPAILLGGCEAAVVPIALAARHPDRVRALIVVNGTARLAADEEYAGSTAEQLRSVANTVRVDWEGHFRRFLSEVAPMPWTDLDTLFGLLRPCVTGEALAAFFAGLLLVDVRQELAHIVVPTLVMHSTDNEVIPFPQAQHMAAHIGGARVHALQGARHHIHPSYNDEIARAVRDFLAVESEGGDNLLFGKTCAP